MKIEDIIKSKFTSEHQKAIVNLRYTANFINHQHNVFMEQFDLTMPQFNILRILRGAKEALNINTVKERMVDKSPNSTRLMDKLIEKGLIDRIRCEKDRRVVYVEIAERGTNLLSEIDKEIKEKDFFQVNISDEEAVILSTILDKIRSRYEH
ncbi:MAG: MarR family transcriptional regulator [Bacteroidota bacterium]